MRGSEAFHLHPDSVVLDAGATGVSRLLSGLTDGLSIHASQRTCCPISTTRRGEQWLDCETAGSTGRPKTIRRTPESWKSSFDLANTLFRISAADHYAVLGSLGHSLSLYATLEALHIGATLSILSDMSPRGQFSALQSRLVTVIYATPTQLKQLNIVALRERVREITSVRCILVGGGKLYKEDRDKLAELFPAAELVEFYGTSETSFITLARADAPPGSVGRPYPNVELEIIRSAGTPDCGEVRVSSPYLAQAYLGPPVKQISQPNGFVLTGEIGYQDVNGFLFIKGRADRMITISDVNVYPEAIEGAVAAMESVGACAVVAIADNLRGNRTICFVEPASEKLNPSAVRRHCRETLDEHHVPKRVLPIERIPTLPSGKPDLQTLQKMALVQV